MEDIIKKEEEDVYSNYKTLERPSRRKSEACLKFDEYLKNEKDKRLFVNYLQKKKANDFFMLWDTICKYKSRSAGYDSKEKIIHMNLFYTELNGFVTSYQERPPSPPPLLLHHDQPAKLLIDFLEEEKKEPVKKSNANRTASSNNNDDFYKLTMFKILNIGENVIRQNAKLVTSYKKVLKLTDDSRSVGKEQTMMLEDMLFTIHGLIEDIIIHIYFKRFQQEVELYGLRKTESNELPSVFSKRKIDGKQEELEISLDSLSLTPSINSSKRNSGIFRSISLESENK